MNSKVGVIDGISALYSNLVGNSLRPTFSPPVPKIKAPDISQYHIPEDKTSQLIVLGNGFDLACGLPTHYTDFFKWYFSEFPEAAAVFEDSGESLFDAIFKYDQLDHLEVEDPGMLTLKNDEIRSAWDLLFVYEYSIVAPKGWKGIEDIIAKWVTDDNRMQRISNYAQGDFRDPTSLYAVQYQAEAKKAMLFVAAYLNTKHPDLDEKSKDSRWIRTQLLEELHKIEGSFVEYLSKIVSDDYSERAFRLYVDLAMQDVDTAMGKHVGFGDLIDSVLSFNYTSPFTTEQIQHFHTFRNIHGSAESGQIIFGIDSLPVAGKNVNDTHKGYRLTDTSVMPFTKTYRILKNAHPSSKHLFVGGQIGLRATDTPDLIKVFGHSLGEADYSYFQAIFDQVNLYESDAVLIFYYLPHDGFELERYYQAVVNLLSRYADTLDNPAHGKNLIHKLILEDRLSVRGLQVSRPPERR